MDKGNCHMDQFPPTSLLLIDGSKNHRTYWADQLKRCSPDFQILEASDGQSGLALFRSQRIDCVVMDLALPDRPGFEVLADLVPIPAKPTVPVLVLSLLEHRTVWELAKQYGAYACFHKKHTRGEDLEKAIERAMEFVAQVKRRSEGALQPQSFLTKCSPQSVQ
jgi:DNA-binding NarL/FixJ family response regulator